MTGTNAATSIDLVLRITGEGIPSPLEAVVELDSIIDTTKTDQIHNGRGIVNSLLDTVTHELGITEVSVVTKVEDLIVKDAVNKTTLPLPLSTAARLYYRKHDGVRPSIHSKKILEKAILSQLDGKSEGNSVILEVVLQAPVMDTAGPR